MNKLDQKLEQISVLNMIKIFRRFILILFVLCYVFTFFNASYEFLLDVPEAAAYNTKAFYYSGYLALFYICLVLIEISIEAIHEWLIEKARGL